MILSSATYLWEGSLVHPFAHQLKRRLQMIQAPVRKNKWRYLSVLPVLAGLFWTINLEYRSGPTAVTAIDPGVLLFQPEQQQHFIYPIVNGAARLSSGFGMRPDLAHHRDVMHTGVDFPAATGTAVLATANGQILAAAYSKDWGNYIIVQHASGFRSKYAHMSALKVAIGENVMQSQQIGQVGSTGRSTRPHLHFEIHLHEQPVDPIPQLIRQ